MGGDTDDEVRTEMMKKSILLAVAAPLLAQDSLSVRDAVDLALRTNKSIAAGAAGGRAATRSPQDSAAR